MTISAILVDALGSLKLEYPKPTLDTSTVTLGSTAKSKRNGKTPQMAEKKDGLAETKAGKKARKKAARSGADGDAPGDASNRITEVDAAEGTLASAGE